MVESSSAAVGKLCPAGGGLCASRVEQPSASRRASFIPSLFRVVSSTRANHRVRMVGAGGIREGHAHVVQGTGGGIGLLEEKRVARTAVFEHVAQSRLNIRRLTDDATGLARNTADVLNFCANEGLGDLFVPEGGGGDDQGVYRGGSAPDIAQGSGFRGIGPRGVIGENQDYIRNRRILADVLRGARKRAVDVGRSAKRLAEDFRDAGDYGIAIGGERDAKASLAVESHESDGVVGVED